MVEVTIIKGIEVSDKNTSTREVRFITEELSFDSVKCYPNSNLVICFDGEKKIGFPSTYVLKIESENIAVYDNSIEYE